MVVISIKEVIIYQPGIVLIVMRTKTKYSKSIIKNTGQESLINMNKYVLGIDGMRCGMCEIHVEETITKNLNVKKVKASHFKNQLVVITEELLVEDDFKRILDPTGYRVTSFERMFVVKKLFGWR